MTTNLKWPLTTTLDWLGVSIEETQATFDLETGVNPQVGDKWEIDRDLQVLEYHIHVLSIRRMAEGYDVCFQADPEIESVQIAIQQDEQLTSPAGLVGGGGDGQLRASVFYDGPIPDGKLTFVIETLHVRIPGPWSMQWSPENLPIDKP